MSKEKDQDENGHLRDQQPVGGDNIEQEIHSAHGDTAPLTRESDVQLFLDVQDAKFEELKTDWWPRSVLRRMPWSNLSEYLLARSDLIPRVPERFTTGNDDLAQRLDNRFRDGVRDVVKRWREDGWL